MKLTIIIRRVVGLFVLMVVILGGLLWLGGRTPRYQGRSLESWLQQCARTPLMETQQLAEAQAAVRAIGATQALPELLRLIKTRDTPAREWLAAKAEKLDSRFLRWSSATELQLYGIAGFEALGSNGAPVVAELTALLNDKELAFVAVRCLEQIGPVAETALCQSLTNQNWQVRHWTVPALAAVTDDVEIYLHRIKDRLKDVESAVRFITVQSIGAQGNAPELAVPLLVSALADGEDSVCGQAAEALAGFGTNAVSAFAALTNLVATGRPAQVGAALKALPAIAPVPAISVLSNAVVTGTPAVLGNALRGLKNVAPDLALDLMLAALCSEDPQRRLRAVSVATSFDLNTPGLAAALKSAANDSHPDVAKRAAMTMRQMVNKQKERAGVITALPNEPSYSGKTLGEWLKQRQEGWQLESNAVAALRQMGTNVIPALLARLQYREPVFGLLDDDVNMEAVGALISMPDARPALPELANLMEGDDAAIALRAMLAMLGTGSNAVPYLIGGLTNQFADVRQEAMNYLTGEWSATFPEQRRCALPQIEKLLEDDDANVRNAATNAMRELNVPGGMP